ncbi:hypothetical protein MKW94_023792 [Papaver nudicaule]|uniref:BHLH domain-containing protein n=1 Tax=Papaver nudicaule TaxID=74823 RepID=A0AA41VSQ0_PAPNU|nr:hypothetical protein [Papaver nudicaule]MCL7046790.1 hypothetical protein [Papaver nudicaule]
MNSSQGSHSSSSSSSPHSSSEERDDDSIAQKLQTLKAMIPNLSSTADKRSILEATHEYIQRIHEETESIERDLLQRRSTTTNPSSSSSLVGERPKILSMEIDDLMMEGRFVVKISWRRGFLENANVQRVVEECLSITTTSVSQDYDNPDQMLTTAFVKAKEGTRMTEEQLRDDLMDIAARFGLIP